MDQSLHAARIVLKRQFGYDDFRPGQVDVVASVLSGHDTLGVLPTGGGKSLCYQVPALVLPGLTIVISPLISLMKDQVDRLTKSGVHATFLNSTLSLRDSSERISRVALGQIKLLYVAPERFETPDLLRCLNRCRIALLAIDEAHCISEWGHDFRPSFRRIATVSEALRCPQVVALTATATPNVRRDIVRQLAMRQPRIIVGGFDRMNLRYAVRRCRNNEEKDAALIDTIRSHTRPAVVYAATRATVERIARLVSRSGLASAAYHAGLDDTHRHDVQELFIGGKLDVIVATNAFGMGIDKSNVRLVVHYTMPGTLEAYYQEAGRAGRDGLPADCVLLHAYKDRFTHEWFIRSTYPERDLVERVYRKLKASQVNGRVYNPPAGKESASALRVLQQYGVLTQERGDRTRVRVRLLATPTRIARELRAVDHSMELAALRSLWRIHRVALQQGTVVDLNALPPGIAGRIASEALESLRDRQFVDVEPIDAGIYLNDASADLDSFPIDWNAMARRRAADLAKLDMVQRYAYGPNCRRAFVLRYFGEHTSQRRCLGCDNCLR